PLLAALLQSRSADLRAQAATALGRMKHEDSLEAIEKLAADDPSPLVKRAASAAAKMIKGDQ
ncbi:MAG: HEAT repeat domain-containing protein, partial [Planctomycetes bacterium]|nr:HEAT repeat domain-containing protein [Planctomycetota bacterium]